MAQAHEQIDHASRMNVVNRGFEAGSVAKREQAAQIRESVSHDKRYSGMTHKTTGFEAATESKLNEVAQIKAAVTADRKGMKVSPDAQAQLNEQIAHAARYAGVNNQPMAAITAGKPANSTINQSAGSLPANTPVSTPDGLKTTAGEIAKTNPQAQISVPMDSVFSGPVKNSNNNRDHSTSHSEHGTGNGGNNAANSNSAHGLGGGSHIGGGSQQGGGFHGNW
ncbi:hypothetical protein K4M64_004525 [Salmonella enterica]|nr:hypothetical protein [Salmonella enterica]